MTSIAEIEAEGYDIENGIIRSFGKFENEPISTAVLWARALDGSWHNHETQYDGDEPFEVFTVDAEMAAEFPELAGGVIGAVVVLYETDNGFVHHAVHSAEDFAAILKDIESRCEATSDED